MDFEIRPNLSIKPTRVKLNSMQNKFWHLWPCVLDWQNWNWKYHVCFKIGTWIRISLTRIPERNKIENHTLKITQQNYPWFSMQNNHTQFIVPADTERPSSLNTGSDSPVSMDSSTTLLPARTFPCIQVLFQLMCNHFKASQTEKGKMLSS